MTGQVPKSLVSLPHLKFSCRNWNTSSWHWILWDLMLPHLCDWLSQVALILTPFPHFLLI